MNPQLQRGVEGLAIIVGVYPVVILSAFAVLVAIRFTAVLFAFGARRQKLQRLAVEIRSAFAKRAARLFFVFWATWVTLALVAGASVLFVPKPWSGFVALGVFALVGFLSRSWQRKALRLQRPN